MRFLPDVASCAFLLCLLFVPVTYVNRRAIHDFWTELVQR